MAVDLSPLFSTEYPELISLESLLLSLAVVAFLGFVFGIIHFLANDAGSL